MARLLVIPLVLLALLGGAVIWSGAMGSRDAGADFVFVNRGDIKTLDPNSISWLQDIRVAYGLWEGLCTLEPKAGDPDELVVVNGAAERIDVSDDATVYTFHLRPDGRWTNGDPVVAGDFVFAWRRMLEEPADYTYLHYYIKGAREYQQAYAARVEAVRANGATTQPAADYATVGVTALDRLTLRVTLNHPVTFFRDLVAFPPFFPLHAGSMKSFRVTDKATGHVTYRKAFTHPPHLVGNGPFRLAEWVLRKRLRLAASEHYWDRARVKSRVVDVLSFQDPQTSYLKYETDDVDWLAEVANDTAAELKKRGRKDVHTFPGFGTYFYSINCQDKLPGGAANPLRDARVRRALALAVDRKPLVDKIGLIGQPPATSFVPPGLFAGYPEPQAPGYEPDTARRLLAEAGYPGGKGLPIISLIYNTEGDHVLYAQNVAKQWGDVLGVRITLEGLENKKFATRLHDKDYAIARASWIGDYPDVSTFTDKYLSDSDNNDSGWVNKAYDDLCARAAREANATERLKLLGQAEQILLDEMPIVPVFHYVNAYLIREGVKGVPLDPRNQVMLKFVQGRSREGGRR